MISDWVFSLFLEDLEGIRRGAAWTPPSSSSAMAEAEATPAYADDCEAAADVFELAPTASMIESK